MIASESRISPFAVLLLCLLLLLPAFAARQILVERRQADLEERITARADDLRQMVAHITALSEPKTCFERLIGEVVNRLRWKADPRPVLDRFPAGAVRLFLFSGNGKRIRMEGFEDGSKVISERALEIIRTCAVDPEAALDERKAKLIEGFLGRSTAAKAMANAPNRLVECGMDRHSRLAGIFPFRNHRKKPGFLLALVDPNQVRLLDLARKALAKVSRLAGPACSFGLLDLDGREPDHTEGPARLAPDLRARFLEPRRTGTVRSADEILYGGLLERRFRVYAQAPLPRPGEQSPFERHFPLILGASALVVALAIRSGFGGLFLPIRLQLVVLFGLAGLGGVVTLLGFAREYRDSREAEAIRDEFSRSREILERLEDRFGDFLQRKGALFHGFLRDCRKPEDLGAVAKRLRKLSRFRNDIAVFLVTADGVIVHRQEPAGPYILTQFWGRSAWKTVVRIVQRTLDERNFALFPAERSRARDGGNDLNSRLDREFARLFLRGLGRPLRARVGAGSHMSFMEMACDSTGRAFAALYLTFNNGILERTFLRSEAVRFRAAFADAPRRFLVLPKSGAHASLRRLAPSLRGAEDLRRLNEILSQAGAAEYRDGSWRRKPAIMTGMPGRQLEDFNLYLLSPRGPINDGIARLQTGFLCFSLLILVFMAGLGWFFSALLLTPLNLIERGISNLGRSRSASPIQVSTGDLLEEIATGINAVGEEQDELTRGLKIHEHLFPGGPLSASGVTCRGWHRSPARFGGEIFDHHLLPDGRTAFWIAGIPEYKLGTALRLAMTKMAVRLLLQHESPDPAQTLAAWRERFLPSSGLTSPEAATLAIGVYEPAIGTCTIAASGGIQLLHHRADHGVRPEAAWTVLRPPRDSAPPSGHAGQTDAAPPATIPGTLSIPMTPGDRLLMASAGISPRLLAETARRHGAGDPGKFGPACFAALDGAPEDQTIILFQRTAEVPA